MNIIYGIEVLFDFYPPNQFKAYLPKRLDGTYIVQLKAIDEAGNEGNYSNIFIKIDFQKMTLNILPPSHSVVFDDQKYGYLKIPLDYSPKPLNSHYASTKIQSYSFRELVV